MEFAVAEDAHALEGLVLVIWVLVVDHGRTYGHAVVSCARLDDYLDLIHVADVGS